MMTLTEKSSPGRELVFSERYKGMTVYYLFIDLNKKHREWKGSFYCWSVPGTFEGMDGRPTLEEAKRYAHQTIDTYVKGLAA